MEKTLSITLSNQFFNIEEDAYDMLAEYLADIKSHYNEEEREEILSDIESSIAEKFLEKVSDKKKFINQKDVESVIAILGKVDEIDGNEKETNTSDNSAKQEAKNEQEAENFRSKKLYRDEEDVIIAGVCSGIAAYFSIDAVIIRIIFVLLVFANGIGVVAYIVLWIVMPIAKTPAQRLEMRGQPVNLKKIEEKIKEKSAKIREELKKKEPEPFKRLIAFPFKIIEAIVVVIKKIIRNLGPVIAFFIGLCFVIAAVCGIIAVSFASGVFLLHADSPLLNIDFPLQEFASSTTFVATCIAFYLTGLIPLIFLLLFGITCVRRKNSFKLASSLFFLIVWIAGTVALGLGIFDLAPKIQKRYDEIEYQKTRENFLPPVINIPDLPSVPSTPSTPSVPSASSSEDIKEL